VSGVDEASVGKLVEGLFRREFAHLVAALTRLLGPSNLTLAEDVVHDALVSAMQAWRFGAPDDPKAWILQVAKHRAIDLVRRDRRFAGIRSELGLDRTLSGAIDLALSPEADAENQLSMMFAICDDGISPETHVTLILRLLCGFSPSEIARAFLVDVQTIDRRLSRGRAHLQKLERLQPPSASDDVRARQPSVERALYLLFNEGYHGSDADSPLHPAMCADAMRLVELLLGATATEHRTTHALAALFCFSAARLPTRLSEQGELIPLAEQDRSRWDQALIARGIQHLGRSATGERWTRWHLEAGIAYEHTRAQSVADTDWARILDYYDALIALAPGPVVAMNRALALAELRGLDAGRDALAALADEPKLARYSFYWAARADIERRSRRSSDARTFYDRAAALATSRAERLSYERRLRSLED
jgi:RNA polymerase sigma-70 factor (ECF subfamily)